MLNRNDSKLSLPNETDQEIYIFLDDQTVTGDTVCFKVNVSKLIKDVECVDMDSIFGEPTAHKEKMARLQLQLYTDAIKTVLKEASESFTEMTDSIQNLRNLYDISGNLISNILEIKKSAKLFVATDKSYFRGVIF